jgi:hypothetical protein
VSFQLLVFTFLRFIKYLFTIVIFLHLTHTHAEKSKPKYMSYDSLGSHCSKGDLKIVPYTHLSLTLRGNVLVASVEDSIILTRD